MVDFGSQTQNIEELLPEQDVANRALKIAIEKHKKEHKGEKHTVSIHEVDNDLSEQEEEVIKEIEKQDTIVKDAKYKALSAETITGSYASSESDGGYSHGHSTREAACTCGWRATPQHAMKEFLDKEPKKAGTKYSPNEAGKTGSGSYSTKDLEGMMHGYESSGTDQYQ